MNINKHLDHRWHYLFDKVVTVYFKSEAGGGYEVGILNFDWSKGMYFITDREGLPLYFYKSHVWKIHFGDESMNVYLQ